MTSRLDVWRCPSCGALETTFSRGHAPHCDGYVSRHTARRCPSCGLVVEVDVGVAASHAPWRCPSCRLIPTEYVRHLGEAR